jgi:hypothetical protein
MSKFLLNLLLQIFKAFVNSKIQFLIQKSFSLLLARPTLRPIRPLAQPAHRPRRSPQAEIVPAGPSSPRVGRVFAGNMFSFSDHAFLSRPPLPRLSVTRAPPVRIAPFPAPADPGRKFPRTAAPPRRCPAVIPRSEKEGTKPPYVCPGCSNHMHENNMINRCNVINKRVIFLT